MKLWECVYALVSESGSIDIWKDYIWSTSQPSATSPQHHWDCIFPGHYTVKDFATHEVAARPDEECVAHIVRRLA